MSAIKGSAIASAIDDLNRLVAEGRLSQPDLEAALKSEDLAILGELIQPSSWYSIESYQRVSDLLLETEGRGEEEYLVDRGWRAAERLQSTGLYSQLSADRERWGDRLGSMMATIGPAMFKDSEWSFELSDEEGKSFSIQVHLASGIPDACRFAAQGFIKYLANQAHLSSRIESRRVSATELVYEALE